MKTNKHKKRELYASQYDDYLQESPETAAPTVSSLPVSQRCPAHPPPTQTSLLRTRCVINFRLFPTGFLFSFFFFPHKDFRPNRKYFRPAGLHSSSSSSPQWSRPSQMSKQSYELLSFSTIPAKK